MIAATMHRMAHPPAPLLVVSPPEYAALDRLVRARTTEQRLAQRARIVVRAAGGFANKRIAAELGVTLMTVLLWRRRFEADRLAGLREAPRPGRPPPYPPADPAAKVRDVVGLYLDPPERAIVLSVDEKTQIQALDRTQPMLPLRSGSAVPRTPH